MKRRADPTITANKTEFFKKCMWADKSVKTCQKSAYLTKMVKMPQKWRVLEFFSLIVHFSQFHYFGCDHGISPVVLNMLNPYFYTKQFRPSKGISKFSNQMDFHKMGKWFALNDYWQFGYFEQPYSSIVWNVFLKMMSNINHESTWIFAYLKKLMPSSQFDLCTLSSLVICYL